MDAGHVLEAIRGDGNCAPHMKSSTFVCVCAFQAHADLCRITLLVMFKDVS